MLLDVGLLLVLYNSEMLFKKPFHKILKKAFSTNI